MFLYNLAKGKKMITIFTFCCFFIKQKKWREILLFFSSIFSQLSTILNKLWTSLIFSLWIMWDNIIQLTLLFVNFNLWKSNYYEKYEKLNHIFIMILRNTIRKFEEQKCQLPYGVINVIWHWLPIFGYKRYEERNGHDWDTQGNL